MQNRNFFVLLIDTLTMADIIVGVLLTLLSQVWAISGKCWKRRASTVLAQNRRNIKLKQNIKNFAKNKTSVYWTNPCDRGR